MPEAIVALGQAKRVVGRLRFESDGRRQHSQFEYDRNWLEARDRFQLAPGLPLKTGGFFAAGREDRRNALHACFQDAAPDSWGRALMTRALGGGLTEFDYLTLCDDRTRLGALRFLDDDMTPLSRLSAPVPRLIELERLRSLAYQYESDPDRAGDAVRELAGVAGASGGARPKANVEDNGQLWIAKFTSREDRRAVERAEVATLKLASRCGLRVPEARLELARSDSPVALIRRFDRRGDIRIPYMSARAALDAHDTEGRYYTEIADIIRQISSKPLDDLHELWRRIVFTILVSNTDDHLKNHGFIYAGRRRWRLSPAFDINPAPMRQRVLQTGILEGEPFHASLTLALEAAGLFDFEQEDAKRTASKMAVFIEKEWRKALRTEGASAGEIEVFTSAFQHKAMEQALAL
ncbi:MAG: type II toxin-antitoxin system HipA family toxin [Gammaproteobacteria bacterium]|nr:type II toxin-antitoxin system HipA family toxin [Gammaproteobacteria bacterium]MCY3687855.1 type II toxin-antitoxin system HipA family toxin [Gammaproteobacteria bacterium]MDE0480553.1 type II toxin-antitoxin system HipA family toxin [Gammaproteobacteria bacterium]MDE0507036.1 type II toxin-antitoxin system HipA family toxin [Gammaproteobacteria bacterium]